MNYKRCGEGWESFVILILPYLPRQFCKFKILMFLKNKNNPIQLPVKRFFASFLIAYFIASSLFLSTHNISHRIVLGSASQKVLNYSDHNNQADKCSLCALFILQNQLLSFLSTAFVILSFYLAVVFLIKKPFQLSYLFSSNPPRAPPYFS